MDFPACEDGASMKVVTATEMREIDRSTIAEVGIPGTVLMERAGVAVAEHVLCHYAPERVLVLAGTGNNGGDGLVAARELFNRGVSARVLMAGTRAKLSPDCRFQYEIIRKMRVPVEHRTLPTPRDMHGALVIDALFGTGLVRPITGQVAEAIASLNASDSTVVSVDMPSGISADTGQVLGAAVQADATVTFGAPKRGHFLHPGAGHTARLLVRDIGFPRSLLEEVSGQLLVKDDMSLLVPGRPAASHKGDYGHVLVLAGSRGKTGAALMAARGALRTGAGLVAIGIPEHLTGSLQSAALEEMILPLADTGEGALSHQAADDVLAFASAQADVVAAGPGLGQRGETVRLVRDLIQRSPVPLVLDADALNAVAAAPDILTRAKSPLIITPHEGEFARMGETTRDAIRRDRPAVALSFAKAHGVIVVLKGAPTVIAEPEGAVFFNSTGNAGMATAGTGDVLTGVIAGLLAQQLNPLEASLLGTYLHGLAGDLASKACGAHALLASDIIESVSDAYRSLEVS
jgi:NAD(P)H-hydrate epimerase